MQTGGKIEQDDEVKTIIGVSLVSDVENIQSTNIGVCLVSNYELISWNLADLRKAIKNDVIACPPDFQICTKQGWPLTDVQEQQLSVHQILNDRLEVLIKGKHEKPKCGIKDHHGNVIGFVYIRYTAVLTSLRNLIQCQILKPEEILKGFHFLDGNNWPISSVQEHHMTVSEILIGHCVCTSLPSHSLSVTFSPPKEPPLKKLKGVKELSFKSGKDVCRQLSSDVTDGNSKPKQVLISYVRSEAANHALQLKHQLSALGLSVYLDVHEIQTGVDWQDSLNFAVSGCEVFVPLVTLKYGETQWTNREVKLADVLGKYILPVNFLSDWPPRCLAIQFATTQFIPWIPPDATKVKIQTGSGTNEWTLDDIQVVAKKISDRVRGLSLKAVPSLTKRTTIVKSCACVSEDNLMAITSDRDGKPLIMICVHHIQETYGAELQSLLERKGFEVWCTTELDREHVDHIDGLASSQDAFAIQRCQEQGYSVYFLRLKISLFYVSPFLVPMKDKFLRVPLGRCRKNNTDHTVNNVIDITYSILNKGDDRISGCPRNSIVRNIEIFQEKADDASLVLFLLSDAFSNSRVCQQQVFYCEHRKHVIPILYEDFKMPEWMTMLIGSHGFEMRKDEDFIEILIRRIKTIISSTRNSSSPHSSLPSVLVTMETNPLSNGIRVSDVENEANTGKIIKHKPDVMESSLLGSKNGDLLEKTEAFNGKVDSDETFDKMDTSTRTQDERPSLSSMKTVILN